jgi:cytochrome c oxidase subunit II
MTDFPLFPDQASTTAARVDAVFFYALALIVFFTVMLAILILTLAIRYRSGSKTPRKPPVTHSALLESIWIIVPLILLLILFGLSANVYFEMFNPPANASTIDVVAKQWMWYLQHPEGRREINELHVPIGRPVKLSMTSQDVIHSFYVPNFRVKQDVLPGRTTQLWFEPTKLGRHHLFCAEYCGTEHSGMIGWVVVMEPAEYEEWLRAGPSQQSFEAIGKVLFEKYTCNGCHGPNSEFRAPKLDSVYGNQIPIMNEDGKGAHFVAADDRYIRDSIYLPKSEIVAGYEPIMPSFKDVIPEEDLIPIMAYIKSLGRREAGR